VDNGGDRRELPEPSVSHDAVMGALFATGEEQLVFFKDGCEIGWVLLIPGNDADVVSDYTMNLKNVVNRAARASNYLSRSASHAKR
jgi:hypothetical protein